MHLEKTAPVSCGNKCETKLCRLIPPQRIYQCNISGAMFTKNIIGIAVVYLGFYHAVIAAKSGTNPGLDIGDHEPEDFADDYDSDAGAPRKETGPPRRVFRLWPNGVVKYKISPSLDSNPDEVAKLKATMNDLTKKTCIRFMPASVTDVSYVSILPGLKCSSMIGQQEGVSTLMLSVKKCFGNGTLARSFMRVLGFTYENNRSDRDNFIQINWDNISPESKKKFTKLSAEDYPVTLLPYDFDSVTHYQKNAWALSKNTWTIRAKKDAKAVLGNSRGFSQGDYSKIKKLYRC